MAKYTESDVKAFISYIAPMIREEATKRGYPICSTAIAQAIVEGAAGTSLLAKSPNFNHFGMKAGTTWKGETVKLKTREEYKKGVLTEIYATFRKYSDDREGIKGYYSFISTKRYANLKNAKDYRQYAEYIKKDGWATSSTYVENLISKVEKYGLQKYDNVVAVIPDYSKGKTYTTNVNLNIRTAPNGERKAFEDITENAKAHSIENEDGYAVLKKGSRVTCRGITQDPGGENIWMEIPSGYVAAYFDGKVYIS